jgi:hypothetical protein
LPTFFLFPKHRPLKHHPLFRSLITRLFTSSPSQYFSVARFIQQDEEGSGNYSEDRHQWLGEESAASLHEQASQLAATGELPCPAGAKLLTPKN